MTVLSSTLAAVNWIRMGWLPWLVLMIMSRWRQWQNITQSTLLCLKVLEIMLVTKPLKTNFLNMRCVFISIFNLHISKYFSCQLVLKVWTKTFVVLTRMPCSRYLWMSMHSCNSFILGCSTLTSSWRSRNAGTLCGSVNVSPRNTAPRSTTTFPYSKIIPPWKMVMSR